MLEHLNDDKKTRLVNAITDSDVSSTLFHIGALIIIY